MIIFVHVNLFIDMKYLFIIAYIISTSYGYAQYVREDDTTLQVLPLPKAMQANPTEKTSKTGFKHFAGIYLGNSGAFGKITDTKLADPQSGFAKPSGACLGVAHVNLRLHRYFGVGGTYLANAYSLDIKKYAEAFLVFKGYNSSGWNTTFDEEGSWGSVHLLGGPTGYIPIEQKIILLPKLFWGVSRIVSPKIEFSSSRQNTTILYSQRPFVSNSGFTFNIGVTGMYLFSKRFAATGTLDFFYTAATFNRWEATVQTTSQNNSSIRTEKYVIPERRIQITALNFSVGIVYLFGKENWELNPF